MFGKVLFTAATLGLLVSTGTAFAQRQDPAPSGHQRQDPAPSGHVKQDQTVGQKKNN